jgi:hypothetical protein
MTKHSREYCSPYTLAHVDDVAGSEDMYLASYCRSDSDDRDAARDMPISKSPPGSEGSTADFFKFVPDQQGNPYYERNFEELVRVELPPLVREKLHQDLTDLLEKLADLEDILIAEQADIVGRTTQIADLRERARQYTVALGVGA